MKRIVQLILGLHFSRVVTFLRDYFTEKPKGLCNFERMFTYHSQCKFLVLHSDSYDYLSGYWLQRVCRVWIPIKRPFRRVLISDFSGMKQQELFLLPPGVHCRVFPTSNSPVPVYAPVLREALTAECLAPRTQHNVLSQVRNLDRSIPRHAH